MKTTLRYFAQIILDTAEYFGAGWVYYGYALVKNSTEESLDL